MTNNAISFNIFNSIPFVDAKFKAIDAVDEAASEANVSPVGFQIDESFSDWGEIETSSITEVIDSAAADFGMYGSPNYRYIVDALCEAVTNHFSSTNNTGDTGKNFVSSISEKHLDDIVHATNDAIQSHGINIGEDNLTELNEVLNSFLTEKCSLTVK